MREESQSPSRRSYGQFCGLARVLDVIGDRWNLLIVRELLPGPLRYGELKAPLGGIATNLQTERLRIMEHDGVIERQVGEAGIVYALTPWGAELRMAMEELGTWGARLLARGRGEDSFRPRWLILAIPAMLKGAVASPPVEVGLDVEGFVIVLTIDEDGPRAEASDGDGPATILTADAETVVGLASGSITVQEALAASELRGDPAVLDVAFGASR